MSEKFVIYPWQVQEERVSAISDSSAKVFSGGQNEYGVLLQDGDALEQIGKDTAILFGAEPDRLWLRLDFAHLIWLPEDDDDEVRRQLFSLKRGFLYCYTTSGLKTIPNIRVYTHVSLQDIIETEKYRQIVYGVE